MPDWIEPTILGEPHGANRQYRYGNLHIREYDNEFLVHTDKVDPRKDPVGHLIRDAPEVLVGIAGAALAGGLSYVAGRYGKKTDNVTTSVITAAATGYVSYVTAKKIRRLLAGES